MVQGVGRCSVCTHADLLAINEGILAKLPYRVLAATFSVSPAALSRHRNHFQGRLLCPEKNDGFISAVDTMIEELHLLQCRARRNKNATMSVDLVLRLSPELRAWFALRAQLLRTAPKANLPIEEILASDKEKSRMPTWLTASANQNEPQTVCGICNSNLCEHKLCLECERCARCAARMASGNCRNGESE